MNDIKFNINKKIILMNMAILIPIIIFIYIIILNGLYNDIVKTTIESLTKESYNSQLYIANYIDGLKYKDAKNTFNNKSHIINSHLFEKLDFRVQMYNEAGQKITDSVLNGNDYFDKDVQNAINGKKSYVIRKINNDRYIFFSSPIYKNEKTLGCIRYVYSMHKGQALINNMIIIMIILGIIAILVSLILSKIFSRKIVEPINKLKDATRKIKDGNYDTIIEVSSNDEIEDLAKTFNMMSKSVKNYIENLNEEKIKQKDFLDNVTHEFKTPLTAIIGYSELIPRLKSKEDVNESLNYINVEGNRLLKLVDELLYLSKLGKTNFDIKKENNDLKLIIDETINILQPRLKNYNIQIIDKTYTDYIFIDKDKTKQVILNVLDNAIKYSECNHIYISMDKNDNETILFIVDDGVGISKNDVNIIFNPIKKGNKNINGNGLGLCICKAIMQNQGGDISIDCNKKDGTCIKIKFPSK